MSALQLGRIWAATPSSPNIDPGAAKYKLGWVAEIPVFQMLNYINNRYDTNVVSLAERGMFEWGSDVTYNNAAMAWDEADGFIYISKTASPSTATRPGLNATQWDKSAIQISRLQYDTAVASWSNHIANTSNPHQLTTEILNTYSKSVIDAKVVTVQTNLNNHTGNTANPHNVTATQAGAVPVTGGDYTGLVRHLFASTGIGDASYAANLLTNSTGTFLALGTNPKLGIDNTNKAVFINESAIKSNLLLDSNYITAREAVESTYVPPTPDCEIILRNSININYGSGSVTFLAAAGSRGYTDKSGTAQTAALNTPRYTKDGLYVNNGSDGEFLTIPPLNNLQGATEFTIALDFKSIAATSYIMNVNQGVAQTRINMVGGYYVFVSASLGANTSYNIAPVDHTTNHKIVITSSSTGNRTLVYFDGYLKLTIANPQDSTPASTQIVLCNTGSAWAGCYLNSFRTWLSVLTAQQVSNL